MIIQGFGQRLRYLARCNNITFFGTNTETDDVETYIDMLASMDDAYYVSRLLVVLLATITWFRAPMQHLYLYSIGLLSTDLCSTDAKRIQVILLSSAFSEGLVE
jgi:uncharacterized protein YejL (UPF0352 family)